MSALAWLGVYSLLILVFSIFGGYLPLLGRVTHSRLQFYLSVSAGVMLGAAFFHVMPDAAETAEAAAKEAGKEPFGGVYFSLGCWMAVAVVGLFCIERFIAPHSHELDGEGRHEHGHTHHHHADKEPHAVAAVAKFAASAAGTAVKTRVVEHTEESTRSCDHDHDHEHGHHQPPTVPGEQRAAAPAVAGWMAVLGLTIHTFMNGFGLAAEVGKDADKATASGTAAALLFPGLAMFLAIVLHKPADALAISMVLTRKGVSRRKITAVLVGFALMVPVGVLAFLLARDALSSDLRSQLTVAALAFSAGTFLFIALSDLLPEVQFHKHDRIPLFLALTVSVVLMAGIALLENLGHEGEEQAPPGAAQDHPNESPP
jgi:zinc and cadmium transporter